MFIFSILNGSIIFIILPLLVCKKVSLLFLCDVPCVYVLISVYLITTHFHKLDNSKKFSH